MIVILALNVRTYGCVSKIFFFKEIGMDRFKNLLKYYIENGLTKHIHERSYKASKRSNVLSANDIKNVVNFIKIYAKKYAVPLPGRVPGFKDFRVIKLSSADSKAPVYRNYCEAHKSDQLQEL